MPPKPVKRDSSASHGRFSPLAIPAFKPPNTPRPLSPTSVDVTPETPNKAEETVKNVYRTYMTSLSSAARAQSLYTVFADLTDEVADIAHFPELVQRIVDNLHDMGYTPSALRHEPCTLNHNPVQPCTLSHDPVTVTVTKEVHPASCSTEIKNLRKEISNLKSGIHSLYHSANRTHTATSFVPTSPSPSGPDIASSHSPSDLDSSSESPLASNDSYYESSTASTPRLASKPLLTTHLPMSYANAAKTAVTKSPKEIHRDKTAKSCTKKGTPLNVLVLSDFKSANTASSYKRIAEMRQKVDDILVDNKCKTISWSSKGNLVTKCAKPLSDGDKTGIINSAKATFMNNPTVLNKPTFSYVKFIDVPLSDIEGTTFDTNDFNAMIQQNEKWNNVAITHGPTIIVKKDSTNAKKATIKIGFKDDQNSATAKRLLKTTILFGGVPIRCKPWTSAPPSWAAIKEKCPWFFKLKAIIDERPSAVPVGVGNNGSGYDVSILAPNGNPSEFDLSDPGLGLDTSYGDGKGDSDDNENGDGDGDGNSDENGDRDSEGSDDEGRIKTTAVTKRKAAPVEGPEIKTLKTSARAGKSTPATMASRRPSKKPRTGLEKLNALAAKEEETTQKALDLKKLKATGENEKALARIKSRGDVKMQRMKLRAELAKKKMDNDLQLQMAQMGAARAMGHMSTHAGSSSMVYSNTGSGSVTPSIYSN
ncbi:hypothetical protein JOM56_011337 [Amanita muscaria]